jgi:hypothetical protein
MDDNRRLNCIDKKTDLTYYGGRSLFPNSAVREVLHAMKLKIKPQERQRDSPIGGRETAKACNTTRVVDVFDRRAIRCCVHNFHVVHCFIPRQERRSSFEERSSTHNVSSKTASKSRFDWHNGMALGLCTYLVSTCSIMTEF